MQTWYNHEIFETSTILTALEQASLSAWINNANAVNREIILTEIIAIFAVITDSKLNISRDDFPGAVW